MMSDGSTLTQVHIAAVCAVLNRETSIDALSSLASAMRFELPETPLSQTVIAFDTSAFLRLAGHSRCDDVVDSMRTTFEGKIILPGQAIQEFWNGQYSVMTTIAGNVKKKFEDLGKSLLDIDERFDEYSDKFKDVLAEFESTFGYLFNEKTIRRTKLIIELLQEKALVPYVPRTMLLNTALTRQKTKTPPGFMDNSDGDFYVWADLLLGLTLLKADGFSPTRVLLVTYDKKIDWSRAGVPHPILSSEVAAICGASFETIHIDSLASRLLD